MSDGEAKEEVVVCIEGHHGNGARRRYHVLWANGDTTEEMKENLVDIVNGEEIVNEELLKYWNLFPSSRQ